MVGRRAVAPKQSRVGTSQKCWWGCAWVCALLVEAQCSKWGRLASVGENAIENPAFRAPTGRLVESGGGDVIGQDKNDQDGDNEGIKRF